MHFNELILHNNLTLLEWLFLILKILHDQRQPSIAQQIRIAYEEERHLEFHWLSKFHPVERSRADQIPSRPNTDRFITLP